MYNIRQFKPVLYALLLLGTTGFSLAAQSPGVWVLGTIGILANAWLVYVDRFTPMPRLLANIVTLGSTAYVAAKVLGAGSTPVLVIGQFLVLLQLIKLWEQRANRDYAQLLVLSLLLMVAAAISTASLAFGVLLIGYLFLSLYCCLLFHLKVETDAAKAALAVPEEKVSPETLRQDQRYLSRSMRRLTGFVSAVAIAMAVIVFLFFPRGTGAGVLGPLQFQASQTLTGFSDQVGFQKIAQITQNQEIMAYVQVWHNGKALRGERTLLLRGTALDYYTGGERAAGPPWQWIRSPQLSTGAMGPKGVSRDETMQFFGMGAPHGDEEWRQLITFRRPTGTRALFAMAGPVSFTPKRDVEIFFNRSDGVLQTSIALTQPLQYEVISTNDLDPPDPAYGETTFRPGRTRGMRGMFWGRERSFRSKWDPKLQAYARRPEVSGSDAAGPLAARRPFDANDHELDEQIARNIENHLRTTFTYTLDLTDAAKIVRGQDPMVAFVYDLKRGHCEYFAGAMALMCQSLGLQARVVTGFKCDEYNDFSDQYVVRQSHAHAWVEVKTADGWRSYDPTAARETVQNTGKVGLWKKLKHLFNYLEFEYANAVIAYDNENQENLVQNLEARMTNSAIRGSTILQDLREWLDSKQFWILSSNALLAFVALLALVPVGMIAWLLWERWKLRRRAARIGLESLPTSDQLRLVRQLKFYDDLLRLLERHNMTRPRHLTPLEFAQSLAYLPGTVYETVSRLTELFYRVRFGRSELSAGQHRRLRKVVADIGPTLAGRGGGS